MKGRQQWNFVSTGGGDIDGLNNSMIEHFTGNHNYFLAREIIQNSLDARVKNAVGPVRVVFNLELFASAEIPGFDDLISAFEAGRKYWKKNSGTVKFLEDALAVLQKPKVPFLRISDFNTTGLDGGDSEMEGSWFNLVRSTGSSFKAEGEGGSFGIGKGAPFAASACRVVYYATKNKTAKSIFQGKAELVSFQGLDGDTKRGVGSFGVAQNSVRNHSEIPELFRRKEQGTDIVVAGYKETLDWEEDLIKSVLRNFWYAILNNELEVRVQGNVVNKDNLEKTLVKYFASEDFKDTIEPVGNPLQYYLAVTEGIELSMGKKLKYIGESKFYAKLTEAHLNYVAMLRRSHMVIYCRPFRFPGSFAGVFICDDKNGNHELRKMEPPAHDKWDAKRNGNNGDKILQEIGEFVRAGLAHFKESQAFGQEEIPELYRLLPHEDDGIGAGGIEYSNQDSQEETSMLAQRIEQFQTTVQINPYKVSVLNEEDGYGTSDDGYGGEENDDGGGQGGGGGDGKERQRKVKDFQSRSFIISEQGELFSYSIILESLKSVRCSLKVAAIGEEGKAERLDLISVKSESNEELLFTGNQIRHVELAAGKAHKITVQFKSKIKVALKVTAHAI